MRKLKLQMQITLDGFAAGPNGEHDWAFLAGKGDPKALQQVVDMGIEIASGCDTMLLGRKQAGSGFIDHWKNVADNQPDSPWNAFAKLVSGFRNIAFSRTETAIPGHNLEVENGDLATAVQALKNEPGKDILVYGGVDFVSSLISLDLIDEYFILICPVAIGKGLPIFKEQKVLKLESSTAFVHGKVLNKYVRV